MKRKLFSIVTALALCLSLCPVGVLAAEMTTALDVVSGEERANNPFDYHIKNVYGTLTQNQGRIDSVAETGIVKMNDNHASNDRNDNGHIFSNSGTVNSNRGEIHTNTETGTIDSNLESGVVVSNRGTILSNDGYVGSNYNKVGSNTRTGTITNRLGGVVNNNAGEVSNWGTVTNNNAGGVVFNIDSGTVTNNNGGTVWWEFTVTGEHAEFSLINESGFYIQEGCTVTPAEGYYFSAPPAAENATVVFENGAYTIKNIKTAPVELTVTTASIADAVALVRVNGEDTYYTDIQAAFAAAPDGSTVELLNNVTLPEGTDLTVAKDKNLNLNCSDFTLSGSYGYVIQVFGTLDFLGGTLKNTEKLGSAVSVREGGTFNMADGTLEAVDPYTAAVDTMGDSDKPAKVNISGGSVGAGGRGLSIGKSTTVQLSGGTYGEIEAGSENILLGASDITVPGLLVKDPRYAFFKDGQPVPLEPEQHYLEGPVTVAECTHAGAKATDNGDGTHDITCHACGYNESHTTVLKAEADGTVITVVKGCETQGCGYSEELGKAVFTFENLVYKNPDAKVSWTKTGHDNLGVEVKVDAANEWTAPVFDGEGSYSLTDCSAGEHTLGIRFARDTEAIGEAKFSTECELTFTVAECPHTGITYTQDEGGATHTGTCPLCGETVTGDCTYGDYEYDETNHWQTCTLCGGKKTAAHDAFTTNATASGTVVTVKEGCATCGYGAELGKVTINLPELVYGKLDGVVSASTTLTDWISVSVAVDADDTAQNILENGNNLEPLTMSDLTNGQNLAAGEHTLTVNVMIAVGKTVDCPLKFTVKRATPKGDPTYTAISESGKTLADAALTAPKGWPEGVLSWNLPEDTAVAANTRYEWTFTPTDTTNYERLGGVITLWVQSTGGGGGGIVTPPVDPDPGPDEPDPPVDPDNPDPPVDPGQIETEVKVEEGITEVPEGLKNIPELDTPAKLETAMRTAVTQTGIPARDTAVYDVTLMVSTDGGKTWTPATKGNFPSGGLTVTLPYPAGTDSSYTFTVVHMFTTADFGKTPGDTESPAVTNTEAGLRFTVTGLSPISVGWKAAEKPVEPEKPVTPSRPSTGGGGSSASSYRVTVERTAHGQVSSNRSYASEGGSVTLTVTPDSGYTLDTLTVTDSRGNAVKLTDQGGGRYTFHMPGRAVTVTGLFKAVRSEWENPYSDVAAGAWYYEAVRYVSENGLMDGYGKGLFGPDDTLTRAQFAQILYNQEGRPAVTGGSSFTDVAPGAWYANAAAWAAAEGIVSGYGDGRFGPNDPITREQLAAALWRYAGSPVPPNLQLDFPDANTASGYALDALRWAVEQGILSGDGNGNLAPQGPAARAQAAQMLKNVSDSRNRA